MRTTFKFERVQWPVGHGGFHTGRVKGGRADFRYFFDCGACGKKGKELISEKLAEVEFDFGVISHFDHDHYSELASTKKVNVLFLPYMTPTDMVLYALADQAANALTLTQAFQGFNVLRQLKEKKTRIVMVDGRDEVQGDTPQKESEVPVEPEVLQGGLSWRIPIFSKPGNSTSRMPHEAAVEVLQGETKLLVFKFFNHRGGEASRAFAGHLADAVKDRKLKKADKTPYTSVNDFLAGVEEGDGQVVSINGKALQEIYKNTFAAPTLRASPITNSNLSSLTMFSRSANYWSYGDYCMPRSYLKAQGSRRSMSGYGDGWMLTGDLELTPKTWSAFNDHYFCELSQCAVFNVPHHGSEISLCNEATAFLSNQFFVMPVNDGDDKHPAEVLVGRLQRHEVYGHQTVTTAWESLVAIESLQTIRL